MEKALYEMLLFALVSLSAVLKILALVCFTSSFMAEGTPLKIKSIAWDVCPPAVSAIGHKMKRAPLVRKQTLDPTASRRRYRELAIARMWTTIWCSQGTKPIDLQRIHFIQMGLYPRFNNWLSAYKPDCRAKKIRKPNHLLSRKSAAHCSRSSVFHVESFWKVNAAVMPRTP